MPQWSGLWNDVAGNPSGHSLLINKWPNRNRIKRVVNREGFRVLQALADALVGAAPGGAASATHKRVAAVTNSLGNGPSGGGARTVETVTDISRVTTSADVDALKEMLVNVKTAPTSYPVNKAGPVFGK